MNIAAAITFVFLAIFGGLFFLLSSDLVVAKAASPGLWTIIVFGGYVTAAVGGALSVLGAAGFSFKRNTKFWSSFQPVNVGLLIALWSGMGVSRDFSWMSLAIAMLGFILLLSFVWKHIVEWSIIPIILILFCLVTVDVRGVLQFFHLAIAIVLIVIPIGLMLRHQLQLRRNR
jgi:hypothetical protein